MPNNNSQKNVNNAVQKVIVNVNTTEPKKKPRRKPQPKEDVPIEQEAPVIRPSVQPPFFPRRPQPYMPNVVQVHNNTMPPPPYFQVPQTNQTIAINNLRENFENELHDLHHTLTQNAQTQADLDHANSVVASARSQYENELSSMMTSGNPSSISAPSSSAPSSGLPPPPPYRNPPSSLSESPIQSENYSYAPSPPLSISGNHPTLDMGDLVSRMNAIKLEDTSVKSEPMSSSVPPLVEPSVKSEPMSSSLHGTSVLHPRSVVRISETESGSTVPSQNINVRENLSVASNETPVSSHGISSVGSNGDSYVPQPHGSVGDASRASSLLNEYRNSASGSERSRISSEIRSIARNSGVSVGSTATLQSIVNRINRSVASN
jgi:hypothetical protein